MSPPRRHQWENSRNRLWDHTLPPFQIIEEWIRNPLTYPPSTPPPVVPNASRPTCTGGTGKGHGRFPNPTGQSISYDPGQWEVLTIFDQYKSQPQHSHHHRGNPHTRACCALSSCTAAVEAELGCWKRRQRVLQQITGWCDGSGFYLYCCHTCLWSWYCPSSLVGKRIP